MNSADDCTRIHYRDLDALKAQIREEFGPWSPPVAVEQNLIGDFADMTGDHQWIHLDVERCRRESPYGRPIAHGFLVLALLPKLQMTPTFEVTGHNLMVNYGSDRLRFTGAVPAGSSIQARSRLKAVRAVEGGTVLCFEYHIHVVGEAHPAVVYELLVRFS